jgi:Leucine-rich repeat (LRR) protein
MNNNIKQIPENIYLLENLEKLWLGHNKGIETIPISFAKLKKIKSLGLGDCPNLDYNNIFNALNGIELEQLSLVRNKVSIENIQRLKKILPKTKIYY